MVARRLDVLLPTLGSAGDVHPFIAIGLELKRRGHRATLLTNPLFQALIESHGLGYLPVGSEAVARAAIGNPDVWHLRRGFAILAQVVGPAIEEVYRLIERRANRDTVVVYSTLAFGGRLAQEKLGLAGASVHLQPSVLRTFGEQGMLGNVRLSASHPRWFKQGLFRLIDLLVIDRNLQRPLNELRARLSLPPVSRLMHQWMHSPELVLAMFPDWFAPPQPDWPPNTHTVGFPLWDQEPSPERSRAREFLQDGPPPVVVTPGSAGSTMRRLFDESVAALAELGLRGMLVTNFPEQLPSGLPRGIEAFGYLPFSEVLPRSELLIYHGGVGTLAQALRAGVKQLVVPHGYDQFDSGWRVERLGVGASIVERRYRRARVVRTLRDLLSGVSIASQCRNIAARLDGNGAARAVDLIEALKRT
ncbi:MAG TPA: glycosyltransferase [Steroidobacteraceae bacterium]